MKTTLELPDALLRQVELRASSEGRQLNDVVADLLVASLAQTASSAPADGSAVSKSLPLIKERPALLSKKPEPIIKLHPVSGLPYIECPVDAPAGRMTLEKLLALEHETQTQQDLERIGVFHRQ